jgi:hypothetical protein
MELEDEAQWLRPRVIRMRAALRFTVKPEGAILQELIANSENRISATRNKQSISLGTADWDLRVESSVGAWI